MSRDKLLDEVNLFWLTDSAASSARLYLEEAALLGDRHNPGAVQPPVAVSRFPGDPPAAKIWAPLVYPNLFYWQDAGRGAHFAPLEVPDVFVAELRRAFLAFDETPP